MKNVLPLANIPFIGNLFDIGIYWWMPWGVSPSITGSSSIAWYGPAWIAKVLIFVIIVKLMSKYSGLAELITQDITGSYAPGVIKGDGSGRGGSSPLEGIKNKIKSAAGMDDKSIQRREQHDRDSGKDEATKERKAYDDKYDKK
jgi:hypothetical protein